VALASDYTELRVDRERWMAALESDNKALLAGLGWLILDQLKRTPHRPIVVMFNEEVSDGSASGR